MTWILITFIDVLLLTPIQQLAGRYSYDMARILSNPRKCVPPKR